LARELIILRNNVFNIFPIKARFIIIELLEIKFNSQSSRINLPIFSIALGKREINQ